jgi:hypothetical protein
MRFAFFLACVLSACGLAACASQPLSAERLTGPFSAASFLGDSFSFEVGPRSLFQGRGPVLPVPSWQLDETLRGRLAEGLRARGKEYRELSLDPAEAERALGVRESRWRKVEGRYGQALLGLLFRRAEERGVRYFFLAVPSRGDDGSPLHPAASGAFCAKGGGEEGRAFVYFSFDLSLWDVSARHRVYETRVGPRATEGIPFGACSAVAAVADPGKALEDPAKKTLGLLVPSLFEKMGWGAVNPEDPGK